MKVCDMHCDTLRGVWAQEKGTKKAGFLENGFHVDLRKMAKGDYLLQCFAAFVDIKGTANPLAEAFEMFDVFQSMVEEYPDLIAPVFCFQDIERNAAEGKMSALLTVEEGEVCQGSLGVLRELYRRGVRMMTLTWNYENQLGFPGVPGKKESRTKDKRRGLKEKGVAFVEEMERLGMLIDVSHLSDDGFYDVLDHTKKPFVASHSNARALCDHTRNLTDEMIRKLADRGGVMGMNYYSRFLNASDAPDMDYTSVARIADHIQHIRDVAGIDVIGLGSDFDGIGGRLEMVDCSGMNLLYEELRRRNFPESEIEKIFFRNVLRVFKEVL